MYLDVSKINRIVWDGEKQTPNVAVLCLIVLRTVWFALKNNWMTMFPLWCSQLFTQVDLKQSLLSLNTKQQHHPECTLSSYWWWAILGWPWGSPEPNGAVKVHGYPSGGPQCFNDMLSMANLAQRNIRTACLDDIASSVIAAQLIAMTELFMYMYTFTYMLRD